MVVYVIPSLSRIKTLHDKALQLLIKKYKILPESIYIFVVKNEIEEYTAFLKPLYPSIHILIGPIGLNNMRNHIRYHFPENTNMVCLDDDISDICIMKEDVSILDIKKAKRYPLHSLLSDDFDAFIKDAFDTLEKTSLKFFGIYAIRNGYFMKGLPYKSTNLRFCVGAFWGCVNEHMSDLEICLEEKEDVERTIRYYRRDGGVLRYNHICPITKYYTEKGGMQSRDIDRKDSSKQACDYLIKEFPDYCKLNGKKKTGICEVKLVSSI